MYNFIRIQHLLGKLTADQVRAFAPRWITAEQAEEIVAHPTLSEKEETA